MTLERLRFKSLSAGYGANLIFRALDLDIPLLSKDGAALGVGIVGESGAGKTTLALAIVDPDAVLKSGEVTADTAEVGYIPQEPVLYPDLDVRENAMLFARFGRRQKRFDAALFERLTKLLRLERALYMRRVEHLSGGERQRLMLLRTFPPQTCGSR
jgi:ABC-type multidrug transport system ATPase subunit